MYKELIDHLEGQLGSQRTILQALVDFYEDGGSSNSQRKALATVELLLGNSQRAWEYILSQEPDLRVLGLILLDAFEGAEGAAEYLRSRLSPTEPIYHRRLLDKLVMEFSSDEQEKLFSLLGLTSRRCNQRGATLSFSNKRTDPVGRFFVLIALR